MSCIVFDDTHTVKSTGRSDIIDITDMVNESVEASGITEGHCLVFVGGSTAAITTMEYEPGLLEDMKQALERIAPEGMEYRHNERWHDGNGHSHIRASLIGPSLALPVIGGKIPLGTWQQIVLLEMDNKPRERKIMISITGVE